jgi:lysine 2,3-aminomutase
MNKINNHNNDWRWQIKNSVKDIKILNELLPKNIERENWIVNNFALAKLPFLVTPYFVSLMNGQPNCPIFAQVISSANELVEDLDAFVDPLGEESRQAVPHLVHRYPDRVLFLATDRCVAYCRFCTRKRWVGQGPSPMREQQEEAFKYIENNPQIKEIIFSGGDPLLLSNQRIKELLARAFSIKNISVVRFHTRMLSFAPMRIDSELCEIFASFSPIYLVTHFNHPSEIATKSIKAIEALNRSGVLVLNQSVLLKGINDNENILKELFWSLVKNKIRPYYLHQCDVIAGSKHFRVPINNAIELVEKLRGHVSGLCQPTLVVDIPHGHGKVVLAPNPIVREDENFVYLRGFLGKISAYPKF